MVSKNKIIGIVIAIVITAGISAYFVTQTTQQGTTVTTQQNNTVTVHAAYNNFIDSLPYFVALEEGYFKDANINIVSTEDVDASLITSSMLSGQEDIGLPVATSDVLLIEEKNPGQMKLFLGGAETATQQQFAVLVKPDSPIKSMNGLQGKKIATIPGSVGIIYPKMMFKKYFNPNDVTLVPLSPNDWVSALTSGQVDAVYSVEPLSTIMIEGGAARSILNYSMANSVTDPFVSVDYAFSTKFINEHPETASKIVDIINKAINYMNANPDDTRRILAKYTGLPGNLTASLGWSQYKPAIDDESAIQVISDQMYAQGFLNSTLDVKNIIYSP